MADTPLWALGLFVLAGAGGVLAMLHVLAADARDQVARHQFRHHVINVRNDYVRRLRAMYEGRADAIGDVDFAAEPKPKR